MRALVVLTCAASLAAACGPGGADAERCKIQLLPGDLVITEVFADVKASAGGTGVDTGKEWLEIYNARGEAIELAGVTITHSRPDGSKANSHVMGAATIAPGQFFTLGNAAQPFVPAYIDYGYGADLGDMFNSDGGKLALSCGDSEIDSAIYDEITEGHARELTSAQAPEYLLNDDQASWCQANESEFEAENFGTPGSANDCQPLVVGQCRDGATMRNAVAPGPGDLVITELMPSPSKAGDTTAEWFEARVIKDVDLNGVGLDRLGDATAKPDLLTSVDCLRAPAGSYVVFARSTEAAVNGGLPASAILGTFQFSMITGTPAAPGDVAIVAGTTTIDAVRWTRSTTGTSLQLDPDLLDPTANDAESNFCNATTPYGLGDLGTPGLDNTQCGALPSGDMCDDGGTPRPIVAPVAGQLVISEVLANPAGFPDPDDPTIPPRTRNDDAHREWFEVANVGAAAFDLNGLRVGRVGANGTPVQSARCISVAAGGHAVFARSNDPTVNGRLPRVDATFSFALVDANADVQIARDAEILDAASWKSVSSGVSRQLDPAHLTTTDNDDLLADKRFFCGGQTPYGDLTNKGTPGAANATCPPR
jgi:hypothetical protein